MLLNYDDYGPGPVVVLLHGFPLDHTMWAAQRTTLGSMYRIIAPDLRGHGKSPAPEGIYPIEDMAEDVVELLDALKITEKVVVGGHSMGGYLAMAMAVKYPKRLRGLMLINTRAGADAPATAQVREEMAREVEAAGSVESTVATMLPKLFAEGFDAKRPEVVAAAREQMGRTAPLGVIGSLRGLAIRPDRTPDLVRISVPTLVIAGAGDRLIPPDESRAIAKALPHAQLVEVPDAGHMAPMENPKAVNEAMLKFLASLA